MHLVVTDSGLGGLTVCAGLENALRVRHRRPRLTFVNAWPEQQRGYNDLPDVASRVAVFDRVLGRIASMRPDAILIACNTLSILYEHTCFRETGEIPVQGIVEDSTALFLEALADHPASALVLVGTRTTIESGVYPARLAERGVSADRIAGASCHGLATAIERGPDAQATAALIETCAERAASVAPGGHPLYVGLACTHYAMVGERLTAAIGARAGRAASMLNPNARMVESVVSRLGRAAAVHNDGDAESRVEVVSKVELPEPQRDAVARVIESTSPAVARALRAYSHVPDLF